MRFNGAARAWVDLRDRECRANFLSASFWPEMPPIVASFLTPGSEMLDVGANFGLLSFATLPLATGRAICYHLFEANPEIVPLLHRSAADHPGERLVVTCGCVTDAPGRSRLCIPHGAWGHAFVGERGAEVPNVVLDDYAAEHRTAADAALFRAATRTP